MNDSTKSSCPKCGAPIAVDAPQGLCPKCVLGAAANNPAATTPQRGRTPPPTVEEVAAHFPELEVLELIGAGGMGAVYKARQPKLDRLVALKILSSDLAEDPAFAERFHREGRVLARLNHPHIVSVFDFGTQGPFWYLLMEYVDGVNLREAMQAGDFTPGDCLALVQDICAALKFAHDEGILHRDIKPDNVLLDFRGRVKIADFGLAKLVGNDEREAITLTRQGAVMGTLHYMAPEQLETPQDVDQRADIYSLGVVFYELLTGELPIGRFAPPSDKSPLDPRVDEVVLRALERKREQRFQTVGEVKTEVDAITQSQTWDRAERGGASATLAQATKAPGSARETARFATASAILTATSLLLLITAVFVLIAVQSIVPRQEDYKEVLLWMLGAAGIVVVGAPALLGIILGAKALGDIRQSGGRKSGIGSAMFGALTWPILLLIVLIGLLSPLLIINLLVVSGGSAVGVGPFFIIAIVLPIGGLAAVFLIRTVGRWALAVPRGVPSPLALKAAMTIFAVVVVALMGIPLILSAMPMGGDEKPRRGPEPSSAVSRDVEPDRQPEVERP